MVLTPHEVKGVQDCNDHVSNIDEEVDDTGKSDGDLSLGLFLLTWSSTTSSPASLSEISQGVELQEQEHHRGHEQEERTAEHAHDFLSDDEGYRIRSQKHPCRYYY